MVGKTSTVTTHFATVKKVDQKREKSGQASPLSAPLPSFSSNFLQSFSFKGEVDAGQQHQEQQKQDQQQHLSSIVRGKRRTRSTLSIATASRSQHQRLKRQVKVEEHVESASETGSTSKKRAMKTEGEPVAQESIEKDEEKAEEPFEDLREVPDYIKEDVDILIIGSNPGRMSSRKKQHFSHPSNHFYKALHQSNLTPTRISPDQDFTLINQKSPYFSIGLTNLVARPTRMAQELNKTEEVVGTEILIDLIRKYRPKVGIFVGIGVSRSFEKSLGQVQSLKKTNSRIKSENDDEDTKSAVTISVAKGIPLVSDKNLGLGVGLMGLGVRHTSGSGHTLLYSMPSTSGRVTTHQLKDKAECMAWARLLTSQIDKEDDCSDDSRHDVLVRLI